jgi:hypothetical protein
MIWKLERKLPIRELLKAGEKIAKAPHAGYQLVGALVNVGG